MTTTHEHTLEHEVVSSKFARAFGLEAPTSSAVRLVKILAIILPAFAASFQISTTFWMIHMAETLGGGDYFAGLTLVGLLVVLQMVIQTALDYPTGALGDWIGQRWVIASALFCYAIAFWFSSQIVIGTPFYIYILIYILFGLGSSQESGAFNAWFDNNYRVAMPHDKDRKQYGVFQGRLGMVWQASSTLVLIPGSWLAWLYSRQFVFGLQAIFAAILGIIVLQIVKDLPGVREENENRPSIKEYGALMKDGFKFLWSSRFVTLLVLGQVVMYSTGPVWWNLLLFPLYFSYLVTMVAVSAFRTLIFIPQAITNERSGVLAKRFDPKIWIPRFSFLQFTSVLFYILIAIIVYFFPGVDPDTADFVSVMIPFTNLPLIQIPIQTMIPVILLFTLFVSLNLFGGIAGILTQRVMLDVVPNRIRNSIYSLQPTLIMLVSMPLIAFFGWFIPLTGFAPTFIICAFISLIATIMIWSAFKNPIPKAEAVIEADAEETRAVVELEVT
ncbi:MFS transporter [Candidatus Thorarchaeota archaeon]|nr:MAG: MFS transporter [Candidatus Thorarchaeota archaeon]